jgi:hypothetical protein
MEGHCSANPTPGLYASWMGTWLVSIHKQALWKEAFTGQQSAVSFKNHKTKQLG